MARKKLERIAPTLEEPKVPQNMFAAPAEIQFHVAGANVNKYETPNGVMTVLSLISPIGLAVSVQLSEENVSALIENLSEELEPTSSIETFAALPSGLAGAKN